MAACRHILESHRWHGGIAGRCVSVFLLDLKSQLLLGLLRIPRIIGQVHRHIERVRGPGRRPRLFLQFLLDFCLSRRWSLGLLRVWQCSWLHAHASRRRLILQLGQLRMAIIESRHFAFRLGDRGNNALGAIDSGQPGGTRWLS